MKLQFKKQQYQMDAVRAVVDCFAGQPNKIGNEYQIDQGNSNDAQQIINLEGHSIGFKNEDVVVDVLANMQKVQQQRHLNISNTRIQHHSPCINNLDIEMETGTGKTYVYIKTIYELYKSYGWSKFIIVVPSIAIREGIGKSFKVTQDHFLEEYGKKIRWFIYDSNKLDKITNFSSDSSINVMIINSQAFNAAPSSDASQTTINNQKNKIYREMDSFNSRRPIDVIKVNKPILILDEPQKLEGTEKKPSQTIKALSEFDPLFCLRYSATHTIKYNKIHRLDAVDAYNQKLVKKINVRGITVKGMGGIDAHLNLKLIQVAKGKNPTAKIEIDRKLGSEVKSFECIIKYGDNLFNTSNEVEAYRDGYVVTEIDARTDTVTFSNGVVIEAGKPNGEVDDMLLRRIQIRESIRAHFEKERELFPQGIKVLSLFFIDSVVKYRDYDAEDDKGEYARIFEEEYNQFLKEGKELPFNEKYQEYLGGIETNKTHNGYFSIDKKGKMVDSQSSSKAEIMESTDSSAYDLILKDKERLLSFNEPTRFIFSHSALREGWDNPNIFVICTLKHSDNTVTRRQEVGRGLRISVNQYGERQDNPATVHTTNVLTVIANESYKTFVSCLQKEIVDELSDRPRIADASYFLNKVVHSDEGDKKIDADMAQGIEDYLLLNGYVDRQRKITQKYHDAKKENNLELLPEDLSKYKDDIYKLIDSVFSENALPTIDNDRMTRTNQINEDNFFKKEFQDLWNKINTKGIYQVKFDCNELIKNSVLSINEKLLVNKVRYLIEGGTQTSSISKEQLKQMEGFKGDKNKSENLNESIHSTVSYDLIGKIAENVNLTRKTVANILKEIDSSKFGLFKENPEEFIINISKLIEEEIGNTVIKHLSYDYLSEKYDNALFTSNAEKINVEDSENKLNKHVFDYVKTDSQVERKFVQQLDISNEVVVYSKLPSGFSIPTPVGNYNPDWAIAFDQNHTKHVYFVAETKGSMKSLELKGREDSKVKCAKRFFEQLNTSMNSSSVTYDVVDTYESLMKIVSLGKN
ncbi:DEAD/DEAH box helicase family protein [Methylophilaceae bacterium]|nr:DEAD/DEAH box helicase family protein [Methylophilaceae bacterium]